MKVRNRKSCWNRNRETTRS